MDKDEKVYSPSRIVFLFFLFTFVIKDNYITTMMKELWVAEGYDVRYSSYRGFSGDIYAFTDLMSALGIDVDPEEGNDIYLDFEVLKDDWRRAMGELHHEPTSEDIVSALQAMDMSKEQAEEAMARYLESAEPNDEWLHFVYMRS